MNNKVASWLHSFIPWVIFIVIILFGAFNPFIRRKLILTKAYPRLNYIFWLQITVTILTFLVIGGFVVAQHFFPNASDSYGFNSWKEIVCWRKDFKYIVLISILIIIPAFLYIFSWVSAPVTKYIPLRRAAGLIVMAIIGQVLFKESLTKIQWILIIVMALIIAGFWYESNKQKINS